MIGKVVLYTKDRESNVPRRQMSQAAINALNPEHRAQFNEQAEIFRSLGDQARSPLAREYGSALAESFAADMANFLGDLQATDERSGEESYKHPEK
jgi:predicted P-loop ATPase/GTPase